MHDHTGMLGLAFGGLVETPFCHTVHGPLDGQPGRMYEQVLDLAPHGKLISISMNQRKPKPNLPWIGNCPNALDLSMYPFRRKPGGDYLVFLGRMSPDKGAHRALAVALETGIPLKIAAKCREPLEIRYFDEFIRPHLGGSIEYVGEVGHADKVELLMGARALISPIDWEEPFGLMMIEAMACGTPVISTRRGAVPEIVDHGRTGVVVDKYRDMEDPVVLEMADSLDPVGDPEGSRGALLAGDHGRELRRGVRGDDRSHALRVRLRSRYDREIVFSRSRRWARSPRSRSTCSSTPRSSVTWGVHSWRRSASRSRSSAARSRSSTSSSTGRPRRSPAPAAPGREETARRLGAQAVWLSIAFGIAVSALLAAFAPQLVSLMGGEGEAADYAVTYLRIAAIGFPAAFLALGAQGYLRGVADLRTPLVILIAGNIANVFLELLFVYGFDWGIEGSAWGTAIAQLGMGAAFVVVVLRRLEPGEARVRLALARRVLSLGKWIFIRTTALMGSFVLAGAVATRFGDAAIAAHQVAFQLWIFLALVLDAVAIAGQIIVGRELGAGRREEAYGASSG